MTEAEQEQVVPYRTPYRKEVLLKSNYFIGNKYKASVLENKITYLAMLKIQSNDYESDATGIYVRMKAAEIMSFIESKSGSVYAQLKTVANQMTGNNMGIVDDENERFEFITVINKATYENGVFTIRFANELRDNLINVKKNFTNLPKNIIAKLKKPYSFPLYQLLKSQCYYSNYYTGERNNVFALEIGLSELKLDMGVINANEDEVKRVLSNGHGKQRDFDEAVKRAKYKMFDAWGEFDRKCLRPTVEEINEVTDIYVEYKKILAGHGGKVVAIDFTIWVDGAEKQHKEVIPVAYDVENDKTDIHISTSEKFFMYIDISERLAKTGFIVEVTDIITICEKAYYNKEVIYKAIDVLNNSNKGTIKNVVGFLIKAIQENYSLKKLNGNDSMLTYNQSDSDIAELEKTLLKQE